MQYSSILMLVLLLVIFYFMLIRPENKRKKQAEQMRNSLKKGDKITTIGGIVGTIVQVTDNTIVIETSDDRVRMELTKWAVSNTGVQAPRAARRARKKRLPRRLRSPQLTPSPRRPLPPKSPPTRKRKTDPVILAPSPGICL
jgi:preprotein translocase subunit YajC